MSQAKRQKVRGLILFAALPLAVYVAWLSTADWGGKEPSRVLWFMAIGVASWILLILELRRRPFSFTAMNWFFVFIFFGVAGCSQYLNDNLFYSTQVSTDENVAGALAAISTWIVAFAAGSGRFAPYSAGAFRAVSRTFRKNLMPSATFVVLSTIFSAAVVAWLFAQGGLEILYSREAASGALATEGNTTTQLLSTLRIIPVYSFAISLVYYRSKHRLGGLIVLQALLVLLSNSPTGSARFSVATVYLGLALLLLPSLVRGMRFAWAFLTAFLVVFPTINIFRRVPLNELTAEEFERLASASFLNFDHGDYDAFSMLAYTNQYIVDHGMTLGRQFLAPIFFFVPRSVWPDKPIGTGMQILETYSHQFTNVSAPLAAEGLVNFGLIGVAFFAYIVASVVRQLDTVYWSDVKIERRNGTVGGNSVPLSSTVVLFHEPRRPPEHNGLHGKSRRRVYGFIGSKWTLRETSGAGSSKTTLSCPSVFSTQPLPGVRENLSGSSRK